MEVQILQFPWTERYFGHPPDWIHKPKGMVIIRRAMGVRTDCGEEIWVPESYISDRATVPRFAHLWVTPAGDLELASYPHDYIYSHLYKKYSKRFADELFKATLIATPHDIPRWKINASYRAVRMFGRGSW